MSDNKVYVGFVITSPGLSPNEEYFKLLPTLSGYREQDTRRLHLTTKYDHVYDLLMSNDPRLAGYSWDDLQIILPLKEVVSARIFGEQIFTELFEGTLPTHKERRPEAASGADTK